MENYQGNEVINYTDAEIITKEYPKTWSKGEEAYYPMNDKKNTDLFEKYQKLAEKEDNVIFGGRLGMYQYFDMWQVIDEALKLVKKLKN